MKNLVARAGLEKNFVIESAGCAPSIGAEISEGTVNVLREKNIPFDKHISKRFTAEEYRKFKCIIALDEEMLRQAKDISGGDSEKKIRLFTDSNGHAFNVNDPFPDGDYYKTFEEIFIGCSTLL